jgi:hypothetical protein
MITFTCPTCRQTLSVPEANAGKKGKCPQCGSILDIPMASPGDPFPAAAPPPLPGTAPVDYAGTPQVEPATEDAESFLMKPQMEFLVPSFIFSVVSFLGSPWAVTLKPMSTFGSVIVGLACLAVSGFALFLAIFAMLKAMARRSSGSWYLLSALGLSGASVFVSLMMFIASFTVPGFSAIR